MTYIMVDIEADGPIPGDYSMIAIGAIVVSESLDETFYGLLKPISPLWVPEALAVSGFNREQTLEFPEAENVMRLFSNWVSAQANAWRPIFVSDNNGFDWQFVNWYFHHFIRTNPFGWSSTHLGSLYKGMERNMRASFKKLRKTKHTHNALDDARGNAEAMLKMFNMGLKA
jgi:DNA polymerase III epsilon subunit-like protein